MIIIGRIINRKRKFVHNKQDELYPWLQDHTELKNKQDPRLDDLLDSEEGHVFRPSDFREYNQNFKGIDQNSEDNSLNSGGLNLKSELPSDPNARGQNTESYGENLGFGGHYVYPVYLEHSAATAPRRPKSRRNSVVGINQWG